MKSKVNAKKNKQGGWDIKGKATSHEEILSFFIVGFNKLLEQVDYETAKTFKECMVRTLDSANETVD